MEHEGDDDSNCRWYIWNDPKWIGQGSVSLRNQRISRDHPEYSIIKISQNTEKSPEDLSGLANIGMKNP